MPLTPTEAADVARRHGLSLQDAAGLMTLAQDAVDAETIAKRFAEPDTAAASLDLTRRLFDGKTTTEDLAPDDFASWLGEQIAPADPAQTEEARDRRRVLRRVSHTAPPLASSPEALFSACFHAAMTGDPLETTTDESEIP